MQSCGATAMAMSGLFLTTVSGRRIEDYSERITRVAPAARAIAFAVPAGAVQLAVASASLIVAVGAMIVAAITWVIPRPVAGSMIWE